MAPDTSFDRLHFSVQQVFAEIRIVWQLVDIWLVPSTSIKSGDLVRIHMGNVIPFDGTVTDG